MKNFKIAVLVLGVLVVSLSLGVPLAGNGQRNKEQEKIRVELPAVILDAFKAAYPGYRLLKAEELTKDGQRLYELQIRRKGRNSEVTIDPGGKIQESAPEAQAATEGAYHLLKKHVLGGEGGWDYMALDGRTRLLYVTHSNAVEILNVDTGIKQGTITGLQGVHGVAFAPDRNRFYISNGRGNSVSVFDLETRKLLADVPSSGQNPDAVMYDAFSDRVFTFNGRTRRPSTPPPTRSLGPSTSAASRNSPSPTAKARSSSTTRTRARSSPSTPSRFRSRRAGRSRRAKARAAWPSTSSTNASSASATRSWSCRISRAGRSSRPSRSEVVPTPSASIPRPDSYSPRTARGP
jgi:hypothetical protein